MNICRRPGFILMLLFCAGTSSAQLSKIFSLPFPKQYAAIDSVLEEYDRTVNRVYSQAFVDEIKTAAVKNNNEQTQLNCRRSILNYKYICSPYNAPVSEYNSLVDESHSLLDAIDEEKYPELKAMVYKILGNIYYIKTKQFSLAFENYLKAYNLFKNVPVEKFPDRQYSQYVIAFAYYEFRDYKSAIMLGNEIESLYPQKNHISIYTIDMIGMAYLRQQRYDSSIAGFQWILDHLDAARRPVAWRGIASGNIGMAYYQQENYDKAIPYLDTAVQLTIKEDIPDNTAGFAAQLALIYLKKQNKEAAKKYIEIAHIAANKANDLSNYPTVYKALAEYYKQTGDPALALQYNDSSIYFRDSIAKLNDVNFKYQAEMAVENEKKKQEDKIIAEERRRELLMRNGLIIFILLVMIIALLFYNRNRLKNKHREQQLLAEKQLAESELNNAVQQLNDFTKSIIEKNELLEKASTRIDELNKAYQQLEYKTIVANEPANDSLKLLQESVLLTDEDWINFTHLFEKVYPGFFNRLKEKLPGFFPAETRFLALSKLKLNTKEMAAMLGVSTDAIRQSRSRMRKKLNLAEDSSVEEAVDKI